MEASRGRSIRAIFLLFTDLTGWPERKLDGLVDAVLVNPFEFVGEDMNAAFEFVDARFESVFGGAFGFGEQHIDGGAGQFRNTANSASEAELAEAFVFLFGETEADHATAGFERHRQGVELGGDAGDGE